MNVTLQNLAAALGGEISNGQVLAPGPNHSAKDRSLAVRPDGDDFVAHSYAGDDWRACRDHVRQRLGITHAEPRPQQPRVVREDDSERQRIERARAIWDEAADPRGTVVQTYLASRGLKLPDECGGHALRYHPGCPWEGGRRPAMIAAYRDIGNSRLIVGIHRTALTPDGEKIDRKMMGITRGAAIMLDPDESVSTGLAIAEGIESALAGRELGWRPCWALGSAGAIAKFPVLSGIECLNVLGENDEANRKAVQEVGTAWVRAGREVLVILPRCAGDMNDALKLRGAA